MEPVLINSPNHIPRAVGALRGGELLLIPTDTVYGLAADAQNSDAIARLYALKQRPHHQCFSLLVSDLQMAQRFGVFDERAVALAEKFWPGAMTIIVNAKPQIPVCPAIMAGGATIGLRVPAHAQIRQMIAQFGGALAAPSANIAGAPAPCCFEDIAPEIRAGAGLHYNDGPCAQGIASTLVDVSGAEPRILREGNLAPATIMAALACQHRPADRP